MLSLAHGDRFTDRWITDTVDNRYQDTLDKGVARLIPRGDIRKAAQVILARERGEMDLVDRKIFNYLLGRVYGQLRNGEGSIHRVPVADILRFLRHSSTDRLHESLSRLGSVEILIDYVDDDNVPHSSKAHYLSYDISRVPDGWVCFAFDSMLLRFLHNPKVFATLKENVLDSFQSSYGARLYEIMALQVHKRYPHWEPTLEVFRDVMAVGDDYRRYDNLRRRVIETAVEEVNAVAPFVVGVEDLRGGQGGKVIALRFTAVPKGPRTLKELSEVPASTNRFRGRRKIRDPYTIDILDNITDAERGPLELCAETITQAAENAQSNDGIDCYIEEWRERIRGRRIRNPDRAFLNWLDIRLAKDRSQGLDLLDEDAITALVEGWESAR